MNEIWKDVEGFEGLYKVSSFGRIKSIRKNKFLSPYSVGNYLAVKLYDNYRIKVYLVHRLVALHFIPNPTNLPEINHKDEDKHNNYLYNLEWCDRVYNCNYGTGKIRLGIKSSFNKRKPVEQLTMEGEVVQIFNSAQEAGQCLNKYPSHISSCCHNKRTSAFGFKWRFTD